MGSHTLGKRVLYVMNTSAKHKVRESDQAQNAPKRRSSSGAEHVLGKDGAGGSIPPCGTIAFPDEAYERFWSKMNRGLPDDCWFWTGPVTGSGGKYGAVCFDNNYVYAHRFSYMIHNGEIPEGKVLLHTCDNSRCVNPNHLEAGSQKQNIHDAMKKDRWMTPARKEYLAKPAKRAKWGQFAKKNQP